MQLDKKRWDEAITMVQGLGVSRGRVTTLKNLFETKGGDASQVPKRAKHSVQDYESAVVAVENLQEILELARGQRQV